MSRRVVIIGGGAAGTAAAFAAVKSGAKVTVVLGRPGATSLGSGALDGPGPTALGALYSDVHAFIEALALWEIAEEGCKLATTAGLLRTARGRDRALLDVGQFRHASIAVVDASRPGWDAIGLARAWNAEPWARAHGVRFDAVAVDVLRYARESTAPDADLAAQHDDPERVAWLVERLKTAPSLQNKRGIVLGPWLGTRGGVAARVAAAIGKPIGEPLSAPGGAAGLRFEAARDALFAKIGVTTVASWATRVTPNGAPTPIRVELDAKGALDPKGALDADAVVLAVGGLVSGGIRFTPHEPFTLSVAGPAVFALRNAPLITSGSPHGAPFESFAWTGERPAAGFERVGIWTSDDGRLRAIDGSPRPTLFAAGDAVADAPRTLIDAICSGSIAGRAAALESAIAEIDPEATLVARRAVTSSS
jgi:glycerol-3-phosphate dehydrogenase subunit B